jgi:hypothetical protein
MARNAMHLARQETLLPWPARKIDRSGSLVLRPEMEIDRNE